jgi:magnesium transporter
MITVSVQKDNRLVQLPAESVETLTDFKHRWVHMINPNDREIEFVEEVAGVPADVLKAALDEDEKPRIEKEDEYLLVLVDIPVMEDDEDTGTITYSTLPMSIIVVGNTIITVCLSDTAVIRDFLVGRIKDVSIDKTTRFVFRMLFQVTTRYLTYLRQIDKNSQKIQNELRESMRNEEMLELLDIQNSLVYFSNSLRSNNNVIDKMIKSNSYLPKYEEDQDLIEDVGIESLQALDTCNTFRDILAATMEAYGSVINNNMNKVMKVLTFITVVISFPTLVFSMFGMNLDGIPGNAGWVSDHAWVFGVVSAGTILLSVLAGIFVWRKKM